MTSAHAPASPQARLDATLALVREKKFEAAVRSAESLVLAFPKAPEAWCALAAAYLAQNKPEAAEAGYAMAANLRPGDPEILYNRALCLQHSWRFAEAEALYRTVLEKKPGHANAWSNRGSALVWVGRFDEGIAALRRAIELDSDSENAHWNLALALLRVGQWVEGWTEFEWRRRIFPISQPQGPEWLGETAHDAKLTIIAEQGLGDAIQFARFLKDAKARVGSVELAVHDPLLPLFVSQDFGVDLIPLSKMPRECQRWTRLMSLPLRLGRVDLPRALGGTRYMKADIRRMQRWNEVLGARIRPRIGIVWQGARAYRADHERSIPLTDFAPVFETIDADFISLQKGYGSEQLIPVREKFPIRDFGDDLDQEAAFLDTAAVLAQLDVLVTSDTSLVHLAGALGVKTCLLLAWMPDWRWGIEPDTTAWYDSVRLFRQREKGQWRTAFEPLIQHLKEVLR